MSNFAFLNTSEWSFLLEPAKKAEDLANSDARASCFYSRRTLELSVAWLYKHDQSLRLPYQDNLSALIHEPTFRQTVGDALFTKARLIKDLGNLAVHSSKKVMQIDAINCSRELFHFCYWLARTYSRHALPDPSQKFDPSLIPLLTTVPRQTLEAIQKLAEEVKAKDEHLASILSDRAALDAELRKLREEIAQAKKDNSSQPDTHDYSEADTRRLFIDLLLKEAGWSLDPAQNFEVEVTGMPNNEGKGFVDYVLWGDDGKPLALIEAKRTTKSATVGQQQAKLYADCLEQMHGQRPIIFYSNGYEHWLWDDLSYPPRAVQGFFKKQELELLVQRRSSRKELSTATINSKIIERPYQTRAVRRVSETFERDNQRKALLVMATGAGKTRTVIALSDVLMRCNWAKRVLFLADRVALVIQAVNAFKAHLPDASPVNLVTDKSTEGRVFVSTYPTMMGLIDEASDDQRRFGPGHFDLIIIDEAHRSVYQKYRAIFDYFDSLLVGLTATPKDEVDHNTYSLFDLEDGVPTDAYDLDQAVGDGHLVPPIAMSVPLKIQRDGLTYDQLSDEEKEQWDALEWSEDGEAPSEVSAEAINQWLFNIDTVDKVLETLMVNGQRVAGGDRLGKTIIFAKNNAHADFIAKRFDINYPQYSGHFARVVTYKTEYAQSLIEDFSEKDKMPHIAISVDMLDTGIDVPEVLNLVFFKIVRSKTKFWQMLGRGTRLCPNLFAPGKDKQNFFIFDFCQNLEFFKENPKGSPSLAAESLSTKLFRSRLRLINTIDQTSNDPDVEENQNLRGDLVGTLHATVAAMNTDNFVVRPQRKAVETFAKAEAWAKLTQENIEELSTKVAPLPSERVDDDLEAKLFDLLLIKTQLSLLDNSKIEKLKERVQAICHALEELESISVVKAEMVLIQAVGGDDWWVDVTVHMLENVRRKLRELVKLIPKSEKKVVYSDFKDELGETTTIDLPQVAAGINMAKFKEKAMAFLRAHDSHLALQRLKRNQQLTSTGLDELERMLIDAGGAQDVINQAKENSEGLGLFIRSLVGLDREAAMQAFSSLIAGSTATANQIEFINMIVQELTQNGVMQPVRLFQTPYTYVSATGPGGVFPPEKVTLLVDVLKTIRERAVA